jgi:hypothetical protein
VRFFEIKKGNPKYWLFNLDTYNTAPIDPAKFKGPCSTPCIGACALFAQSTEDNLRTA